jgi:hypothetical protein
VVADFVGPASAQAILSESHRRAAVLICASDAYFLDYRAYLACLESVSFFVCNSLPSSILTRASKPQLAVLSCQLSASDS